MFKKRKKNPVSGNSVRENPLLLKETGEESPYKFKLIERRVQKCWEIPKK